MYDTIYIFKNLFCILLYINYRICVNIYEYLYCRKYVFVIVSKYVCVTDFFDSIWMDSIASSNQMKPKI